MPATQSSNTADLSTRTVRKEYEVFEASGKGPTNLQTPYEALLTIKPTSVEAERPFSACGLLKISGPALRIQQSMRCAS